MPQVQVTIRNEDLNHEEVYNNFSRPEQDSQQPLTLAYESPIRTTDIEHDSSEEKNKPNQIALLKVPLTRYFKYDSQKIGRKIQKPLMVS